MSQNDLHVVFGAGPLGKWTARELVKMGKTVRMVNRSGQADRLPPEVELVASDAYDAAKNVELTRDAAAVYQCAQPHYYEWAEKFPPLQKAILEAAAANGARLVVGDNLYMYGQFEGRLREDFPIQPNTRKGRVRAAMAQDVLEAHRAGKVRAAIGRASDFFGPDDLSLTRYAVQPAVEGKPVNLMGRADQPHTFTYVADFGRLLATLGTRDEALGQVWFAPGNPPLTQAEFVKLIEAGLGHPVKTMVGGPLMMRLIGLFKREVAETVEMLFQWTRPFEVDTSKAEKALGLKATPMDEAIRETLAWCKEGVAGGA
ncbi:MAG: NAD-dependent epimerase/dehydratase family protein [Chloroflexota bacterium]